MATSKTKARLYVWNGVAAVFATDGVKQARTLAWTEYTGGRDKVFPATEPEYDAEAWRVLKQRPSTSSSKPVAVVF